MGIGLSVFGHYGVIGKVMGEYGTRRITRDGHPLGVSNRGIWWGDEVFMALCGAEFCGIP
jgi:hypothetical protein